MKIFVSHYTKIVLVVFFFSYQLQAQIATDSIKPKEKKLKFGCGFGLNFVGGTSLSLAPNLTYKVSEKISFGAGIQGSYNKIKNLQNTTTFGGNLLGFYTPIKNLQTQLEFAQLWVSTTTEANAIEVKDQYWDSALFVGAGYTIGQKVTIGAKYNFLYDEDKSVYSSPVIPFVNIVF